MTLSILQQIKGRLVVSCQALDDEPLHSDFIMARMALAAEQGGAAAIRANGVEDVKAIMRTVALPVIGIIKRDYAGSDVYITPTLREIDELMAAAPQMIALDATGHPRPWELQLAALVAAIRAVSPAAADGGHRHRGRGARGCPVGVRLRGHHAARLYRRKPGHPTGGGRFRLSVCGAGGGAGAGHRRGQCRNAGDGRTLPWRWGRMRSWWAAPLRARSRLPAALSRPSAGGEGLPGAPGRRDQACCRRNSRHSSTTRCRS